MEMHLLDLFFIKRRSPLDPESSRTLIVIFLTFSPELKLGSGFLAQSEHDFLLFSFILVLFSSNFFDLDNNFFSNWPFSGFLRKVSWSTKIFLREIGTFRLLVRKLLVLGLSNLQTASFFTKNAHHRNHQSHLTNFCGFDCNFVSPHFITRGYSSDFDQTGLSR
jgi:hypothetical protein